jgi:hypothetical protein
MRTQSIDTSPEFERVQIARIRAFSAAKKFRSVRSWTQSITTGNLYATHGSSEDRKERNRAVAFVTREYGDRFALLFLNAIAKQPEWRLQTPDIQEALLPLIEIAEQLNTPALLIGSVASSIYGLPRSTQDVDVLANFHKEHLPILLQHFAPTYVFDPHDIILSEQQPTSFSLLHLSRLIKIDVFLPSTVFEKAVLEHQQSHFLIEGRAPLLMASAEDMTLLNLIQYHVNNTDDRWNDILGILKVQALTLNLEYLDQQAKALSVEQLLAQALVDAGIRSKEPY